MTVSEWMTHLGNNPHQSSCINVLSTHMQLASLGILFIPFCVHSSYTKIILGIFDSFYEIFSFGWRIVVYICSKHKRLQSLLLARNESSIAWICQQRVSLMWYKFTKFLLVKGIFIFGPFYESKHFAAPIQHTQGEKYTYCIYFCALDVVKA